MYYIGNQVSESKLKSKILSLKVKAEARQYLLLDIIQCTHQ